MTNRVTAVPVIVRHDGTEYFRTSKTGIDRVTGRSTAEYADESDRRVWRDSEGNIVPE